MTAHAIARAKQRLGIDVGQADFNEALALLGKSVRAIFIQRDGSGREHWLVPLKGVLAGFVVQREHTVVLTVMTPAQITTAGKRGEFPSASTRAQKRRGSWSTRENRMMKREEREEA